MPDILIRGMEMPKTCSQCQLCYDYMMCSLREGRFSHMGESFDCCEMRLADCPLVELPKHGDLIDRDAILNAERNKPVSKMMMFGGTYVYDESVIKDAPAVIQAERRDEDA